MLPLLALTLKPRDIRLRGDDLRLACHRAVVSAVRQALPLAGDLARAAARLRAVAPKLRAKAAGRAVDLFLSGHWPSCRIGPRDGSATDWWRSAPCAN